MPPIDPPRNVFLIGFSGTGKTRLAREVAACLGWTAIDTDDVIETLADRSIPAIFAEEGETAFRELETRALERVSGHSCQVVATGGGIVLAERNRRLMRESGFVVCLEARPKTIRARLERDQAERPAAAVRPLLEASDPLGRIRALKSERQAIYADADWTLHTDLLTPAQAADEIVRALAYAGVYPDPPLPLPPGASAVTVRTASADYPVVIGFGLLARVGELLHALGLKGRAFVLTDDIVAPLFLGSLVDGLRAGGWDAEMMVVPAGEVSKSLETATRVYDWLLEQRAERRDVLLALGGGVIGDLGGFVAATYQRGMPLVHVPTTLLAVADSSIGGKTAVNHPRGKNMVGAFYQPRLVLDDISALRTLPRREVTSGWAEVIKHGFILAPALVDRLEAEADALMALEAGPTVEVLRESVAIKAEVVGGDEREADRRIILNYGHTVAHGLEAATSYTCFLHGEAVAIGMMAAAEISRRLGLLDAAVMERQCRVLERFGLPTRAPGVDADAMLAAMTLDKKSAGGSVRWVLLGGLGRTVCRSDVPSELVRDVVVRSVAP